MSRKGRAWLKNFHVHTMDLGYGHHHGFHSTVDNGAYTEHWFDIRPIHWRIIFWIRNY